MSTAPPQNLVQRFGRWVAWAVAIAAVLFVAASLWFGIEEVAAAFGRFWWPIYVPVLLLTLVNYGLRAWKWHYLVRRLGVEISAADNLIYFASGLAMVISPAKAGELLKPYLVRLKTGTPMVTTIPALVTERLTDGIAVLVLAAISVGRFASDRAGYVYGTIALTALGLLVLSHRGLSLGLIRTLGRLPFLGKVAAKLEELYTAMRTCLAAGPLLLTVVASIVAWGAECVGYLLVLRGFGVEATLDRATFLYAFATVAGGPSPGGLGVADGLLIDLPMRLVEGLDQGAAVASAALIRIATLWFGVLIGAAALVRIGGMLADTGRETAPPP